MTQAERVREYIKTNGSITPIEATVDLGIIDLARTISYMRKQGDTDIVGRPEKAKKILQDKYDQAKDNPNITDPVEWALYRTWQIVKRRNRNDRIRKNNK